MAKQTGLTFYKRKKKISSKVIHEIFSWILSILVVIFVATVLVYFYGMSTNMVGVSMESTIHSEQGILIDRFSYVLLTPKDGDVVLFLPNGNENSHYYVRRVVAGPGDVVQIRSGHLYVNGELSDVFLDYISVAGIASDELELASDEYFVLGDNVSSSEDSRSADIGPVKITDIVGKVWFRLSMEEEEMGFVK